MKLIEIRFAKYSRNSLSQKAFTLLELLVVVGVTVVLTAIVTANFASLRTNQRVTNAANDIVSRMREIQNSVLAGKILSGGAPPRAYVITFTAPASTYLIQYNVGTSTTTLETVTLPQNLQVSRLLAGGSGKSSVVVRFESPFANLSVDGAADKTLQANINLSGTAETRAVIVDPVSGRINIQ